jgi:hypothetical protein
MGNFSVDLGGAVPYLVESFLELIGKDAATKEVVRWFSELQKVGLEESSYVQAVGMHQPIPIEDMYQPTRLMWLARHVTLEIGKERRNLELSDKPIPLDSFLGFPGNAIILAGPGWGKTTLVRFVFKKYARAPERNRIPVLFTIRRPNALNDLEAFVDLIHKIKKRLKGNARILLLVDGYDEASISERKRISNALLRFSASYCGQFYLTCRTLYDIYELSAPHIEIAPFSREDQERYVKAFSKAYGTPIVAAALISDLEARGFKDFLAHPLLLALTCIVRTGPLSVHSRNAISLISRAIDTLTFRWDEAKGIFRETKLPLDGRDRMHCLMRVAYHTDTPLVNEQLALSLVREQLDLLRWEDLDAKQVLLETARFYGIFTPTAAGKWEFVHKTLYDYLGARFWVEVGKFNPAEIKQWTAKAAYAACLTADATESMKACLKDKETLPMFAEMLSNDAPFDHVAISEALIKHYEDHPRMHFYEQRKGENRISVELKHDFITIASTKFLVYLADLCGRKRSKVTDTLVAYALSELRERGHNLSRETYQELLKGYGTGQFIFNVHRDGAWVPVVLEKLAPSRWPSEAS